MRKIAKLISMLLVFATLLSVCSFSTSAATFKDVSAKDEALFEAVQLLNTLGIAKGQSATTYGVNKDVTREQMAAFIFRLMKGGKSVEGGENTTTFTDLEDDTFFAMISWANQSGIIKGRSQTEFDPYGGITLQDCYVMIVRALEYENEGPLSYPFGYIDIAERIGLSEDLSSKVTYEDELTRGQVAIILKNAFYADMNKTVKKGDWYNSPSGSADYVVKTVPATVASSIFDVQKVVRRVVATPNYAIDISPLDNPQSPRPNEYKAYAPTGKNDVVLIETAAICLDESITRLPKEKAVIEFADTGLTGEADDYFLHDIELYVNSEGKVIAANTIGETVEDKKFSVEYIKINDNYDTYGAYGNVALCEGILSYGADSAYFYNKPTSVKNYAVSIAPTSSDKDGRITFTANRTWCGDAAPLFEKDPAVIPNLVQKSVNAVTFNAGQTELNNQLIKIISTGYKGDEGRYTSVYYDCNNDGVVDFLWVQPFTFGKIVDKPGDANKTTTKHIQYTLENDSRYRAVYNSTKGVPEIYVGGANIVGGKYEHEKYAFAYVAGPANYVRIAPAEQNAEIKEEIATFSVTNNDGMKRFDNGTIIWPSDSARVIVGHVNCDTNGNTTGIVRLSTDKSNSGADYDSNFSSVVVPITKLGSTFRLVRVGVRALLCEPVSDAETMDIAENYAIVRYADKQKNQVVFDAGGIESDGTLTHQLHVQAFINDKFEIVPIAEKVKDSNGNFVYQDDAYFIGSVSSPSLVNTICTYKVNEDGEYTFIPLQYNNDATNLTDTYNESLTYTNTAQSSVGLQKFADNVYKFVAVRNPSVPTELTPNGTQLLMLNKDTKVVVNYIENGQSEYAIYANGNFPNIDPNASPFNKVVVVYRNNKTGTTTEYLKFMYAEVGGEIYDKSDADKNLRIVLSRMQQLDEKNNVITKYTVVNPVTGEKTEQVDTFKSSGNPIPEFMLYKVTEDGKIQNDANGLVASLALNSGDLKDISVFEKDANLLFVNGRTDAYIVDDKTVYALFDRDTGKVTIEEADVLTIDDIQDTDDKYHNVDNNNNTKQQLYVVSERRSGETLEFATLVIIARGK